MANKKAAVPQTMSFADAKAAIELLSEAIKAEKARLHDVAENTRADVAALDGMVNAWAELQQVLDRSQSDINYLRPALEKALGMQADEIVKTVSIGLASAMRKLSERKAEAEVNPDIVTYRELQKAKAEQNRLAKEARDRAIADALKSMDLANAELRTRGGQDGWATILQSAKGLMGKAVKLAHNELGTKPTRKQAHAKLERLVSLDLQSRGFTTAVVVGNVTVTSPLVEKWVREISDYVDPKPKYNPAKASTVTTVQKPQREQSRAQQHQGKSGKRGRKAAAREFFEDKAPKPEPEVSEAEFEDVEKYSHLEAGETPTTMEAALREAVDAAK